MKILTYDAKIQEATRALTDWGAFLTTSVDGVKNTMVIGWGSIGYAWGRPIFTVLVRDSRYTYELMEKASEFTVSIPLTEHMKSELQFCGTKSGRDLDKFAHCNLRLEAGHGVDVPIIADCQLHYECRIVGKLRLRPENLHESCHRWYPKEDYHTFYTGEIVACYENA